MLTPKQEVFCQALAGGKTQADAYRSAYNVKPTTKPETTQNKAHQLMQKGDVRARVDELKTQLAEKLLWSREDSLNEFISIVKEPDNQGCKISALKELNVMCGYNAPTKTELSGSIVNKIEVFFGRDKS
jgi:hypothetical protein